MAQSYVEIFQDGAICEDLVVAPRQFTVKLLGPLEAESAITRITLQSCYGTQGHLHVHRAFRSACCASILRNKHSNRCCARGVFDLRVETNIPVPGIHGGSLKKFACALRVMPELRISVAALGSVTLKPSLANVTDDVVHHVTRVLRAFVQEPHAMLGMADAVLQTHSAVGKEKAEADQELPSERQLRALCTRKAGASLQAEIKRSSSGGASSTMG